MNTWIPPVHDGDPLDEVVRSMPKAEIHIHLEDVFEVDDVVRLASDADEPLPRPPATLFEFDNIGDMLPFYDWACGLFAPGSSSLASPTVSPLNRHRPACSIRTCS